MLVEEVNMKRDTETDKVHFIRHNKVVSHSKNCEPHKCGNEWDIFLFILINFINISILDLWTIIFTVLFTFQIIEPKESVKKPTNLKKGAAFFVFFFGSENYARISEDSLWLSALNKDKFVPAQRIPKGFKEAIEAIDDALASQPEVSLVVILIGFL